MNRLQVELATLLRYVSAGALNTAVGVGTIFVLTFAGAPTLIANALGYLAGFALGFFLSKRYVFGDSKQASAAFGRYTFAFMVCFAINLCVVAFCERIFKLHPVSSQLAGVVTYTGCMYVISRLFVFGKSTRV